MTVFCLSRFSFYWIVVGSDNLVSTLDSSTGVDSDAGLIYDYFSIWLSSSFNVFSSELMLSLLFVPLLMSNKLSSILLSTTSWPSSWINYFLALYISASICPNFASITTVSSICELLAWSWDWGSFRLVLISLSYLVILMESPSNNSSPKESCINGYLVSFWLSALSSISCCDFS